MDKLYITRVWLDGHHLFAMTEGGKTAHYDLSTMRGFRHATQLQLANFVVNGKDIHWPDLPPLRAYRHRRLGCLQTRTTKS